VRKLVRARHCGSKLACDGQVPVEKALTIAKQIAGAPEAAHGSETAVDTPPSPVLKRPSESGDMHLDSPSKVLLISHTFPPDAQVGARRVAEFCRYLPEFGLQPVVLTIEDRFRQSVDLSLPPIVGIRNERTEVTATPLDWYKRSKVFLGMLRRFEQSVQPPVAEGRPHFLKRHLTKLLQFPGPDSGWYRPALRAAERLIREESPVAIFSSGPPAVSHRIACRLKREHNLLWIADFRDPWATCPYENDDPGWWRWVNRYLESKCVRAADLVICNTEGIRQNFLKSYPDLPQQRFVTLTNGFVDHRPLPANETPVRTRRLFLHLGSLYHLRRIDTFCSAVESLVKAQELDPATFQIVFLGFVDSSLEVAARKAAPTLFRLGCIEFRPRVDKQDALQILCQADMLLVFQGGFHLQVPAKFYEYLATGQRIFAVAQKGALTDMLEQTGSGLWADPEDPAEIAANFLRALALPVASPEAAQERWYGQFHYRSLTARLAAHFRDLAFDRDVPRASVAGSAIASSPFRAKAKPCG